MKSLSEIAKKQAHDKYIESGTHSWTYEISCNSYVEGFEDGVKVAEERAQVLVDAIIDVAGSMDNGWSETLYNHLETYKKSMEAK